MKENEIIKYVYRVLRKTFKDEDLIQETVYRLYKNGHIKEGSLLARKYIKLQAYSIIQSRGKSKKAQELSKKVSYDLLVCEQTETSYYPLEIQNDSNQLEDLQLARYMKIFLSYPKNSIECMMYDSHFTRERRRQLKEELREKLRKAS